MINQGFIFPQTNKKPFDNDLHLGIYPYNGGANILGAAVLFTTDRDGIQQIYSMESDGANQINQSRNTLKNYRGPFVFNGGGKVAFSSNLTTTNDYYVANFSVSNGILNPVIVSNEVNANGAGGGDCVISSDNSVMVWSGWEVATIDGTRGALRARKLSGGVPTGPIVTLNTGLAVNLRRGQVNLNSDASKLYYAYLDGGGVWRLRVGDFDKNNLTLTNNINLTNGNNNVWPNITSDNNNIICATFSGGTGDIYKYTLTGTTISSGIRLTSLSAAELNVRLSQYQDYIVFNNNSDGDNEIYSRNNIDNDVIDNTVKLTSNLIADFIPWQGDLKI